MIYLYCHCLYVNLFSSNIKPTNKPHTNIKKNTFKCDRKTQKYKKIKIKNASNLHLNDISLILFL